MTNEGGLYGQMTRMAPASSEEGCYRQFSISVSEFYIGTGVSYIHLEMSEMHFTT